MGEFIGHFMHIMWVNISYSNSHIDFIFMPKSQPRCFSTCVKFGNDPGRDPECMTSHPVLGFSAISRKLFVVETSS